MMITRETGDRLDCGPSGLGLSTGRAARRTLVAVPTCRQRFPSPRRRAPARCNAGNATTFRNDTKGYNADNQLTSPATFVYDGNGNPTTFSGTTLTFDPENRLTAYGSTLTAGYRGDNLRAWKQTSSGTTYFLYDGINVVCELDGSGSVTGQSVFGANGLLSRGSVQYQFDPLGDATLLLDGSESVTAYRLFDAWGNELSSGSTDPRGYRAQVGYYTDVETGLVALAYRYYSPGMGRFINRDPVRYFAGSNVYTYVDSGPTAATDAMGLAKDPDCVAAAKKSLRRCKQDVEDWLIGLTIACAGGCIFAGPGLTYVVCVLLCELGALATAAILLTRCLEWYKEDIAACPETGCDPNMIAPSPGPHPPVVA